MTYPDSWDKQESSVKMLPDIIAKFISPQASDSDLFREKLSVTVEDLTTPLSLNEYTKLAKEQIIRLNPGAKIISERETTLGARAAYSIVYSVREAPNNLQKMETWTLKDFKVYSLTYEAEADKYNKYEETVKEVLRSVKFEK
jgi:serine/threonine-protein kinase